MSRKRKHPVQTEPPPIVDRGYDASAGTPEDGSAAASAEAAEPPLPATALRATPYRSIFTCSAKGFELGENRRFKQRVFTFKERPAPEIIEQLKEAGFTYRSKEKTWTVPATSKNRVKSDELAADFAGAAGRDPSEAEIAR